eukprot:gene385-679_t
MVPNSELEKKLFDKFGELSIKTETTRHEPVMTVDAMMKFIGDKEGGKLKNLFLKDKKKNLYLLTALTDSDTNMKAVGAQLKNAQLRFADNVEDILGVKPGAVTPFAVMNDPENKVQFLLDSRIKGCQKVWGHPLHNEASSLVTVDELVKFATACGHEPTWIECVEQGAAPAGGYPKKEEKKEAKAPAKQQPKKKKEKKEDVHDSSMLGITVKKSEDFSEWYTQVIQKSEMIEYYDISGCYILRPMAFFPWQQVQNFFNKKIEAKGVKPCYFPTFVSKAALEKEKDHVEGFSPEVAWVTRSGDSELAEPIAIRPTSETIMYPAYAKWIRSHRDLPLLLNQWCSVVRWEFKCPTPFIRTREFLWQEGHTAHATHKEAEDFVFGILDDYESIYRELYAVPVIKGIKSEGEKFAGGHMTTTVEAFVDCNGRAIQAATSHHLGTNFGKMFNIMFENEKGEREVVHQASWGLTTRSIGTCIMIHGDDKGLVMPPPVAMVQVIGIPIPFKDEEKNRKVQEKLKDLEAELKKADVRAEIDLRENYNPGWKYNHWEVKGVPLRMEVGPRDLDNGTCRLVRRDTGEKMDIQQSEVTTKIPELLVQIHKEMLERAEAKLNSAVVKITTWDEVIPVLQQKKMVLAPWCEEEWTEKEIKEKTKDTQQASVVNEEEGGAPALTGAMKPLCIPLEQPDMPEGTKCFFTGKPAKRWCLWGRSY